MNLKDLTDVDQDASPADDIEGDQNIEAPADNRYAEIIRSGVLEEDIIILKDRSKLREIQKEYPNTVIYLPQEINKLMKLKNNKEALKNIHLIKKLFDGWIY